MKSMAGFITYWPKEHIKRLVKEKDNGLITVIFGSVHTKMPSIKSVKLGDTIYPVTIMDNEFYVVARLPVETIEPAYDYLVRELGNKCGALTDNEDRNLYFSTPMKPHKYHQEPFNCCAETAAQSTCGSTIELRQIPKDAIPKMLFGPTKSKQKALRLAANGLPSIVSVSGAVRRMSDETYSIFESLF
jgi:hypothetical protein